MTTFGVELEFVLVYPDPDNGEDSDDDDTCYRLVEEALSKPINRECTFPECEDETHEYKLPVHDVESLGSAANDPYQKWQVIGDSSLELSPEELADVPKGYIFSGMEVVSRVFNAHGSTPLLDHPLDFHDQPLDNSWYEELRDVLLRIQSLRQRGCLPLINWSTGLHVHVRTAEGTSFNAAKNMMTMFTAMERHFDSIMPHTRISAYSGMLDLPSHEGRLWRRYGYEGSNASFHRRHDSQFCKPMSSLHLNYLEDHSTADVRADVPAFLTLIGNSSELGHLMALYRGFSAHSSALNLENLLNRKRTIEVRCHAGSLDLDEISSWVHVVVNMAQVAASIRPETITLSFLARWQDANYDFADFVRDLDIPDAAVGTLYTDMQSPVYAVRRYANLGAQYATDNGPAALQSLFDTAENKRCSEFDRGQVNERIRHKFECGFYGPQVPGVVQRLLGNEWADPAVASLILWDADAAFADASSPAAVAVAVAASDV